MVLAAPASMPTAAEAGAVSQRILDLVNAARRGGRRCGTKYFAPAAPLALNVSLARAALAHSRDMAQYDMFDHQGRDGSTPSVRVERAGYGPHRIVGENIAAGAMSAAEVTEGWLASPAHCENIMDGRFTHIGIAYAASLKADPGMYWTQDFALRDRPVPSRKAACEDTALLEATPAPLRPEPADRRADASAAGG